jgi:Fe-S oxidoreductase
MKSPYSYHVEPFELKDRPGRFLEALAAILKHSNYGLVLDTYSRTGAKCARCSAACPIYLATHDVKNVPCWRSELVLRVYRRYFTIAGMLRARVINGFTLTDAYLDELAEELYHCTACRRCKFSCPMGIDHGMITHIGRWALAEIGIVPKALRVSVREQLEGKTHNTSGIPVPALLDTCQFLEEEIMEKYGHPVKFPIDREGADMVFFPAVSDYLLEPDTLMGNAAVMYATGGSWTIGSRCFDGINYGLFYSDRIWDRIVRMEVAELWRLKGKTILIGECGHASRSAKVGVPTFCGPDAPPVINIIEYTYRMMMEGKLKLKANTIKDRVTYHDPCNLARSGWIVNQPREILRAICSDFVDMTPKGAMNYCCGGGSGVVSIDEVRKWRTGDAGRIKAEQLRATGAKYVVAPCANCKKQLKEVIEDNGIEGMEVVGLHDLVIQAIDFGPGSSAADGDT